VTSKRQASATALNALICVSFLMDNVAALPRRFVPGHLPAQGRRRQQPVVSAIIHKQSDPHKPFVSALCNQPGLNATPPKKPKQSLDDTCHFGPCPCRLG
jgi:hypothetical protein